MIAQRSTFLLLLAAACLALLAGPAYAEPVETPPDAPPAGEAADVPDGPPPGVVEEEIVEVMKAAPGRMPDTNGPKIPNIIGQVPHQAQGAVSAWRVRIENVVTDRAFVGRVVDQHPDAGTTLAEGEVLTLVVGIPTVPSRAHGCVPAIEGLKLEAAVAALRDKGFDVMLRAAESFDSDKGIVLAQAPRPASVAMQGEKVTVVVGKGGLAEPVAPEPEPLPAPVAPEPIPAPVMPEPVSPDGPPAGPTPIPSGPPPAVEPEPPVVVDEPAPPMPPAEEPPTAMPPAEEPVVEEPAPPVPPTEEPPVPMPPADETPLPAVEDTPAPVPVPVPVPVEAPKPVLRVPTLAAPGNAESYPRAFGSTFKWGGVTGAKAYEWEIQAEASDGTWSTVTTETVEGTTFRPKQLEAGRFRWRVRAVADDVQGEWSEFRKLFLY